MSTRKKKIRQNSPSRKGEAEAKGQSGVVCNYGGEGHKLLKLKKEVGDTRGGRRKKRRKK